VTIVALKGECGHDISRVDRVERLESDEDSVERREVMGSSRIESVVRLERIGSENGDVMADVADMTMIEEISEQGKQVERPWSLTVTSSPIRAIWPYVPNAF